MKSSELLSGTSIENTSHLSTTQDRNSLVNGLIPPHRVSETLSNRSSLTPNHSPNQLRRLTYSPNKQFKRSKKVKDILLIICLSVILAFLFLTTIELSRTLVQNEKDEKEMILSTLSRRFNSNRFSNQTTEEKTSPIKSFFGCVWLFNLLLFIISLFLHLLIYQRRTQRNRTRASFHR